MRVTIVIDDIAAFAPDDWAMVVERLRAQNVILNETQDAILGKGWRERANERMRDALRPRRDR